MNTLGHSYCIAEVRVKKCLLLVCIPSLSIAFSSLRIRAGPCCLPGAIQFSATDSDSIGGNAMAMRCSTMVWDRCPCAEIRFGRYENKCELVVTSRTWYD